MKHRWKIPAAIFLCAVMLGTQPPFASMANSHGQTEESSENLLTVSSANQDNGEGASSESTESAPKDPADPTQNTDSSEDTQPEENTEPSTEAEKDTAPSTESTENTKTDSAENADTPDDSSTEAKPDTSKKDKEHPDKKSDDKTKKTEDKERKKTEDKELKKLDDTVIDEEESAEKDTDPDKIVPEIYGTSQIVSREDAEYMGDFVYFNQGDSAWNQNGYRIAAAGCGPTSMACVISTLTDKWVTPVDTAVWAFEHGYYSAAGSAHQMIPAMAEAFGLKCKGVGTDYEEIKNALNEGKPVVALMGPGYFTRHGHFMVLIDIDKEDHVAVADVGSRHRSSYKYALSDIIRQSKSAGAGGPFWVISKPPAKKKAKKATDRKPLEEVVWNSTVYHLLDEVTYNGERGIITRFINNRAYIKRMNGTYIEALNGRKAISLSAVTIIKSAPGNLKARTRKRLIRKTMGIRSIPSHLLKTHELLL